MCGDFLDGIYDYFSGGKLTRLSNRIVHLEELNESLRLDIKTKDELLAEQVKIINSLNNELAIVKEALNTTEEQWRKDVEKWKRQEQRMLQSLNFISNIYQVELSGDIVDRIEQLRKVLIPPFNITLFDRTDDINKTINNIVAQRPQVRRITLDGRYYTCSKSDFLKIIAWDWVDRRKYIAQKFDCENFAIVFHAHCALMFDLNSVGIVIDWSSAHGYNNFIDNLLDHYLEEPQSDILWKLSDSVNGSYKFQNGVVLF